MCMYVSFGSGCQFQALRRVKLCRIRAIRKHPSGWLRMVETSTKMSREMRVDDPTKQVTYVAETHGD